MMKIFCLLLLIAFTLPGCEKDDICDPDTSTTPRLVIEFYNAANRSQLKPVTNMKVIADGQENGIEFNPDATDATKYLVNNVTKIEIPFSTAADSVRYSFILNSGNATFENTDTVQFNYTRNSVFVSRACGYSIFYDLDNTNDDPAYILNDDLPDSPEAWIKDIDVLKYNLTNENETHLKIYF